MADRVSVRRAAKRQIHPATESNRQRPGGMEAVVVTEQISGRMGRTATARVRLVGGGLTETERGFQMGPPPAEN